MKQKIILTLSLLLLFGVGIAYSNTSTISAIEQNVAKEEKINLNLKDVSIKQIFSLIEQQISNKFIYRSDQRILDNKISITINNQDLIQVLAVIKTKASLDFKITKSGVLVKELIDTNSKSIPKKDQETRKIKGQVLDKSNLPIPGASVFVAGTSIATTTDFDGKFTISVPANTKVLSVSYVGFETKEINIENKTEIVVVLSESDSQLNEVVVMGYGTEQRRNVTASVSSVKMGEIKSLPKANVLEMLEGRLPGVQIMSENSPGGGSAIRIRGFSTINNNDPLVIIDGVPASNGLNGINPSDIETLQVLKDAASSSIYGSRAANGVVVITTKKGGKSKTEMQFDGYSGVQAAFNLPKMLNAQQYGNLLWQATTNDGKIPANAIYGSNATTPIIPAFLNSIKTIPSGDVKWINEIMQPGAVHSYNLSLSKGDQKGQHVFSLGYFNQEGVIKHTGFDRFSARFNSSYSIKDFLTIGENFTTSYSEQVATGTNSALGSIVYDALQFPSIVPVYDINGNFAGNPINDIANPLGSLTRAKDNKQKKIQALGNVFASVKVSDFTIKTNLGLDFQNYNYRGFSPVYNEILSQNVKNSLTTSNSFNYQLTISNTLNYKKQFGKHNLDVLLGQEAIKYYYEGFGASRQNFLYEDPNFRYLTYGTENQLNTGTANEWALNSYFGRVNYNFNQKYLFSATVRRDGTSRLANNNWGTFPAVSGGWRLDKEDFFNFGKTFSSFLVRASWGQTGNQQLPSYSTVNSYSNNNNYSNYAIGGQNNVVSTGLTQTRVSNANLSWETTTQKTIGFDFGFFNNKLNVTAEYYNKETNDILVYNVIPLTYGGTNDGQWINDGQMKNHGFELDLKYSDKISDFSYDLGLNLTGYKNELTGLKSMAYLGIPSSTLHTVNFDQEISRSAVGQPIGSFYGYVSEGLFRSQKEVTDYGMQPNAKPGDLKFKDINGDGVVDSKDRTFIGSPHPDIMLGFTINLKYKKFDLGMFFNGSFGNDIYNLTKYKTNFFNQAAYNKDAALLGAWTVDNPNSNIPRLSLDDRNNNIRPSSYYVEDGSYFKLNNLQLGYTFSSNALAGTKLRLYGQASNVFTITKYSGITPQIGLQSYSSSNQNLDIGIDRGIYPTSRTFTVGCNLNF